MSSENLSAEQLAIAAKAAFDASQLVDVEQRNVALHGIRKVLEDRQDEVFAANQIDLDAAEKLVAEGKLAAPLLRRLSLKSPGKYASMLQGLTDIAALPSPTDAISYATELDEGLELYRVACPIGVLLVIFESRPEVVVNIAALAIKSGNAAILKGGRESTHTARLLTQLIADALRGQTTLPPSLVQTISTRDEVSALLHMDKYIDLVIPRGGNALVASVKERSRIPVMGHADGICSVYVDEHADHEKARRVVVDSKTDYPSVCNATETLLLHSSHLTTLWPSLALSLLSHKNPVTLHCDAPSLSALQSDPSITSHPVFASHVVPSTPEDYTTEWLDYTLSVQTVPSLSAAIAHVNTHGSHHTDAIVSEDARAQNTWLRGVDSAGVYVNASTRFADGFRYGFGAEVGVATGKTHARGPVGLEGLVIYKYVMRSKAEKGHVVGEFGEGGKKYLHRRIEGGSPWSQAR